MKIIKNPTSYEIDDIINTLKEDKLVVYPTDTLYGIASNITSDNAIRKVYDAKKRAYDKPISICVHDYKQLEKVAVINKQQKKIIKQLLPGTYTLLLKKKDSISNLLTSNTDIIGIRIPDNEITYKLTKDFPITTTSANISDKKTPDNINDIKEQLHDLISVYIDEGIKKKNISSTIIDLTKNKPDIIRYGLYEEDKIKDILKMNLY